MPEKRWTKEQAQAIESEDRALLVSAAAGSGKTAVLVERAVRLITRQENPLPADRLLIVTFTNAAAQELRSRIGVRLEEELHKRPGDAALRRQRLLLRRAVIGTIDAYCQQLVKENFARLALPPDIAVGEAGLLAQLSQNALDATMEEMYANVDFARLAALYGRSRSDRAAQEAIIGLYEFTRTLPHPARQLARFAAMYASDAPFIETPWADALFTYATGAAGAIKQMLAAALAAAEEEAGLEKYIPVLMEDRAVAQSFVAAVNARNWDAAQRILQNWQFAALAPVRGESPAKERIKGLRGRAKEEALRLGKYCFVCTQCEFEEDRSEARPMVEALVQAVLLYEEKYMAAKLAEKVFDFSDFEHLALSLLQNEDGSRTQMARQIGAAYDAVMVDEYQDTNELQDALYACLGSETGENLFYVGDVKQSIYRFRKANPGLFLAKQKEWPPLTEAQSGPAVVRLGHNFRSGQGVVGGVNFLFTALMSPQLGEIEYNEKEQLIQGSEGGEEAGLELRILQEEAGRADAAYTAARIRQMVDSGYLVREGADLRPCEYGDFCILLRARARIPEFVAALEALEIPAAADGAENLLQTPEVLPLSAALAAIDNPGDDINLAAAMLGPLFRFSADEMTRLRAAGPAGSLWGALVASTDEKCAAFVQDFSFYRALACEMPVGRLCEELVGRTGYLSAVAAMEGGPARRENLLQFIDWATQVSATGRGTLSGFVRLVQNGNGPAQPSAAGVPGRVNILTIHKSKGLEFPVCFLADAARSFNMMDLTARVQMHAQLGVGFALRSGDALYATLPALAIRARAMSEALSEEMRILYVALTRAKEKMIITFCVKDAAAYLSSKAAHLSGGPAASFLLMGQRSMADWITFAALYHPDADPLLCHCEGALVPRLPADGRFLMSVEEMSAAEEREREAFRLTAEPDEELVREIARQFSLPSPLAPLRRVPVKLSVSQLAKPQSAPLRRRPSFMYANGLTAAEKGTLQHSFLQYADFAAAQKDMDAEIERLAREGYLSESTLSKLDQEGIRAFLQSDVLRRMLAAKELLREYAFITAVPASRIDAQLPPALQNEKVLVQGIADAVLVFADHAEIVDYKTDKGKDAPALAALYAGQLNLYAAAVAKRLALPVTRLSLWAFALQAEIDMPLQS